MNEDKLTTQQVMREMEWTFYKDNEEATRKETEAAVDYVLILYEQCIQEIEEQARLLGMSAERELSLRADVDYLMKVIATYHSKYPEIAKTLYSAFSDYGQRVGSQ